MRLKQTIYISVFLCFLIIFSACGNTGKMSTNCINGKGIIQSEMLSLSTIENIESAIAGDIIVTKGTKQEIYAIGHQNIIELLPTEVKNNTWHIKLPDDYCYENYELTIHIATPTLKKMKLSGSGNIIIQDVIEDKTPSMEVSKINTIQFGRSREIRGGTYTSSSSESICNQQHIWIFCIILLLLLYIK